MRKTHPFSGLTSSRYLPSDTNFQWFLCHLRLFLGFKTCFRKGALCSFRLQDFLRISFRVLSYGKPGIPGLFWTYVKPVQAVGAPFGFVLDPFLNVFGRQKVMTSISNQDVKNASLFWTYIKPLLAHGHKFFVIFGSFDIVFLV